MPTEALLGSKGSVNRKLVAVPGATSTSKYLEFALAMELKRLVLVVPTC